MLTGHNTQENVDIYITRADIKLTSMTVQRVSSGGAEWRTIGY
jgi:hypothetical protein